MEGMRVEGSEVESSILLDHMRQYTRLQTEGEFSICLPYSNDSDRWFASRTGRGKMLRFTLWI